MKYKIITLGCKVNQYESDVYRFQLEYLGCKEDDNPDFFIINSCTVTKNAEKESISKFLEIKKKYPTKKIYFIGCASKKMFDFEKEDFIKKIFSNEKIPSYSYKQNRTRAFLKIQDGCNNFCTYCIIPKVRGRSRSKPLNEIIEEVKILLKNHREIVLTGINISDYKDGKNRLLDLLQKICEIKGIFRIRLSSLEVNRVKEDLISFIIKEKKICPHIHLVLQSGSNRILEKMQRRYRKEEFLAAVKLLKKREGMVFSTDVIIGFPEEKKEDFEESIDVIKKVQFLKVHLFSFSRRKGTKAYDFPQVKKEILEDRKKRLLKICDEIADDLKKSFIGKRLRVLLEKPFFGHADNFLPVALNKKGCKGTFVNVFIKDVKKGILRGIYED